MLEEVLREINATFVMISAVEYQLKNDLRIDGDQEKMRFANMTVTKIFPHLLLKSADFIFYT